MKIKTSRYGKVKSSDYLRHHSITDINCCLKLRGDDDYDVDCSDQNFNCYRSPSTLASPSDCCYSMSSEFFHNNSCATKLRHQFNDPAHQQVNNNSKPVARKYLQHSHSQLPDTAKAIKNRYSCNSILTSGVKYNANNSWYGSKNHSGSRYKSLKLQGTKSSLLTSSANRGDCLASDGDQQTIVMNSKNQLKSNQPRHTSKSNYQASSSRRQPVVVNFDPPSLMTFKPTVHYPTEVCPQRRKHLPQKHHHHQHQQQQQPQQFQHQQQQPQQYQPVYKQQFQNPYHQQVTVSYQSSSPFMGQEQQQQQQQQQPQQTTMQHQQMLPQHSPTYSFSYPHQFPDQQRQQQQHHLQQQHQYFQQQQPPNELRQLQLDQHFNQLQQNCQQNCLQHQQQQSAISGIKSLNQSSSAQKSPRSTTQRDQSNQSPTHFQQLQQNQFLPQQQTQQMAQQKHKDQQQQQQVAMPLFHNSTQQQSQHFQQYNYMLPQQQQQLQHFNQMPSAVYNNLQRFPISPRHQQQHQHHQQQLCPIEQTVISLENSNQKQQQFFQQMYVTQQQNVLQQQQNILQQQPQQLRQQQPQSHSHGFNQTEQKRLEMYSPTNNSLVHQQQQQFHHQQQQQQPQHHNHHHLHHHLQTNLTNQQQQQQSLKRQQSPPLSTLQSIQTQQNTQFIAQQHLKQHHHHHQQHQQSFHPQMSLHKRGSFSQLPTAQQQYKLDKLQNSKAPLQPQQQQQDQQLQQHQQKQKQQQYDQVATSKPRFFSHNQQQQQQQQQQQLHQQPAVNKLITQRQKTNAPLVPLRDGKPVSSSLNLTSINNLIVKTSMTNSAGAATTTNGVAQDIEKSNSTERLPPLTNSDIERVVSLAPSANATDSFSSNYKPKATAACSSLIERCDSSNSSSSEHDEPSITTISTKNSKPNLLSLDHRPQQQQQQQQAADTSGSKSMTHQAKRSILKNGGSSTTTTSTATKVSSNLITNKNDQVINKKAESWIDHPLLQQHQQLQQQTIPCNRGLRRQAVHEPAKKGAAAAFESCHGDYEQQQQSANDVSLTGGNDRARKLSQQQILISSQPNTASVETMKSNSEKDSFARTSLGRKKVSFLL